MATSLSNLVNNLSEGFPKINCKFSHHDKNVKLVELHCDCFLGYTNFKDDLKQYKF